MQIPILYPMSFTTKGRVTNKCHPGLWVTDRVELPGEGKAPQGELSAEVRVRLTGDRPRLPRDTGGAYDHKGRKPCWQGAWSRAWGVSASGWYGWGVWGNRQVLSGTLLKVFPLGPWGWWALPASATRSFCSGSRQSEVQAVFCVWKSLVLDGGFMRAQSCQKRLGSGPGISPDWLPAVSACPEAWEHPLWVLGVLIPILTLLEILDSNLFCLFNYYNSSQTEG